MATGYTLCLSVSRRILLSATTSPVNLFLALYITLYVPSLIFFHFLEVLMKPSKSGQPGLERGPGNPAEKGTQLLGAEEGNRAQHPQPEVGMECSESLALVNLSNLKQYCDLHPSSLTQFSPFRMLMVVLFNFLRNFRIICHSGAINLHSQQLFFSISLPTLIKVFLIIAFLRGVSGCLMVLIGISLMISDVEPLGMCLLAICM